MSLWARLFSAPAVVEKSVDAAIAAGDKLVYTDEERAEMTSQRLEWILRFHEASSGSRIARRLLAVMFAAVFLFLILLTAGLLVAGLTDRATALLNLVGETLVIPVGMIVTFYFAAGALKDWKQGGG